MARRVLLDFDFLGEALGLTVDGTPAIVALPDGSSRSFIPGATVDSLPHRSSPVMGESSGDESMKVSLTAPTRQSWALRRAAPIQLATCRVYWWPEGGVLRDEHEIFRGVVRSPEWTLDSNGEAAVSFSLVPARRQDDVVFPPFLIGDEGRFSSAPEESQSLAVPVVYGVCPGLPLAAVTDPLGVTVRLVVACHRILSATVNIMREGLVVSGAAAVAYDTDDLGGFYAYVEVTAAQYAAGSDLYLESVSGHVHAGKVISGLGDVMEHAFRTYGGASWYELDRPRVEAAKPKLNRIAVGAWANDRGGDGTLMQFLQSRLGGQFPVTFSLAGGRLGWDATLFPRGGETDRIVARITYGQDCSTRVGPTETSADDVLTIIDLSYGYSGYQASETASIRFDSSTSGDARRAVSRWGKAPPLTITAPDCQDEASAYVLLTDRALRSTRVRHRVEYQGLADRYYDLPLGGIIEVTDSDLGWTEEPCVLEVVEPRVDGLVDAVLVTLDGV